MLALGVLPAGCSRPDTDEDPALVAGPLPAPSVAAYGGLVGADSVPTRTRRVLAGSEGGLPSHISADGRRALIYAPGTNDLAIQDLATGEFRTIAAIPEPVASEDEWGQWYGAHFSPDGEWVAFWYQRHGQFHSFYPELRVVGTVGEAGVGEVLVPVAPGAWWSSLR